ncbi:hypothetical protein BJ912DRAFT_102570 [Pholiota molesta]|nr:hypothetical protein BJ912DRAFT_102570 [Pholiota molesta]
MADDPHCSFSFRFLFFLLASKFNVSATEFPLAPYNSRIRSLEESLRISCFWFHYRWLLRCRCSTTLPAAFLLAYGQQRWHGPYRPNTFCISSLALSCTAILPQRCRRDRHPPAHSSSSSLVRCDLGGSGKWGPVPWHSRCLSSAPLRRALRTPARAPLLERIPAMRYLSCGISRASPREGAAGARPSHWLAGPLYNTYNN